MKTIECLHYFHVCAKSSKVSVYFIVTAHLKFGFASFQVLVATVLDSGVLKQEKTT